MMIIDIYLKCYLKSSNRKNDGGMSWYFGDDDDLNSFQDILDQPDRIRKEDSDEDIRNLKEDSGKMSINEHDSNIYQPSPTPSKRYYSRRKNESENVARTFQSSHDLKNSYDNFDVYHSHENADRKSEFTERESIFMSDDEEIYKLHTPDNYNQVLHKYGLHRDETTSRTDRFILCLYYLHMIELFILLIHSLSIEFKSFFNFLFSDEGYKLENTVSEKQFHNDVKEDRMVKSEYKNAKISLPKHYYREIKISRDKIAESKEQINGINRKNEDYSNKIMKKVSLKRYFLILY